VRESRACVCHVSCNDAVSTIDLSYTMTAPLRPRRHALALHTLLRGLELGLQPADVLGADLVVLALLLLQPRHPLLHEVHHPAKLVLDHALALRRRRCQRTLLCQLERLLTRRARNALGTATQCTRRND
jgi:hypothetical protein